jgi:hypothetical protein
MRDVGIDDPEEYGGDGDGGRGEYRHATSAEIGMYRHLPILSSPNQKIASLSVSML